MLLEVGCCYNKIRNKWFSGRVVEGKEKYCKLEIWWFLLCYGKIFGKIECNEILKDKMYGVRFRNVNEIGWENLGCWYILEIYCYF